MSLPESWPKSRHADQLQLREQERDEEAGGGGEGDVGTALAVRVGNEGVGEGGEDGPAGEGEEDGGEGPGRGAREDTALPATTERASRTAVAVQTAMAKVGLRPWSRMLTAPPRASGKFEAKMAARSARAPVPEVWSRVTPRAMFSGMPSRTTPARRANPETLLPAP